MKLENYPVEQLKKQIREIASRYLSSSEYEIFFFGSRVRGDSSEVSDIDIGVEGAEKLSLSIKNEIEEEIDRLPMLYKINFVDFKSVSEKFKNEALKYIEKI